MGSLVFVTGTARSGKSRYAVDQAVRWGGNVVYVATYRTDPHDAEMADRVKRHRAERPAWRTLEAPVDAAASLAGLAPPPSGVILDCLTLWAGARFDDTDESIVGEWTAQLAAFKAAPWRSLVVSNELGWSLVPADRESRRFRDLAGTLAQLTAAAADEVWLVVAACPLRLK